MAADFRVNHSAPDVRRHAVYLTGAGTSAPTVRSGPSVTVTRTGTGAYTITWSEYPGVFLGWRADLGASTPADVAGHTVVRDDYDTATKSLPFVLYNASDAAHDLAASEYLDIEVTFKMTGA